MSKLSRTMRVAIIGCGGIAEDHLEAYHRLSNSVVTAVCDINESKVNTTARKYKIKSYYTDSSELFKREDLDIVSICTPTQTHVALAIEAISNGVNVIVEKPMAATVEEAEAILNSLKKKNPLNFRLSITGFSHQSRLKPNQWLSKE